VPPGRDVVVLGEDEDGVRFPVAPVGPKRSGLSLQGAPPAGGGCVPFFLARSVPPPGRWGPEKLACPGPGRFRGNPSPVESGRNAPFPLLKSNTSRPYASTQTSLSFALLAAV